VCYSIFYQPKRELVVNKLCQIPPAIILIAPSPISAALNFQKNDLPMLLNRAMFNDNAHCGYILKPLILLDNSLRFDPLDARSMRTKKVIEIKVISGQRLPNNKDIVKDISDPYVVVAVHGVREDNAEARTRTVKDNGFNPVWNEKLDFVVNCPELAFVRFTVKDDDFGRDQLIGDYAVRFQNIREGLLDITRVYSKILIKKRILIINLYCLLSCIIFFLIIIIYY
jgi:hypothetical protein